MQRRNVVARSPAHPTIGGEKLKTYRELWWPRFWPFLRIKDEMPSHRINITTNVIWYGVILPAAVAGSWLITLCATFLYVFVWIWGPLRFFPAPPRKASNYGVSIVIRRDVLRDEPWVLQQEIYESRYWLRHPWRLLWAFGTFYGHPFFAGVLNAFSGFPIDYARVKRQAAAHLARAECASRAQEIRARLSDKRYGDENSARIIALAHARSIHGAKNYPFIKAAGWTEDDCYNEIVKHL